MAEEKRFVTADLVTVYSNLTVKQGKDYVVVSDPSAAGIAGDFGTRGAMRVLGWGDAVAVTGWYRNAARVKVKTYARQKDDAVKPQVDQTGYIVAKSGRDIRDLLADPAENKVLRVSVVDVQQGDGVIVEAPRANGDDVVMLVDGGDNQLFARYLAGRFPGTSKENPRKIDCLLVTHGDSDHYKGLVEIQKSETYEAKDTNPAGKADWKRLFIDPDRFYHNGLVPRATAKGQEDEKFGQHVGTKPRYAVELVDDPRTLVGIKLNEPYQELVRTIEEYASRRTEKLDCLRLHTKTEKAFEFLKSPEMDVSVAVLWPTVTEVEPAPGTAKVPALRWYGSPSSKPSKHESVAAAKWRFSGTDDGHTINGQSVTLKLTYGKFRMLLTGDLNAEPEDAIVKEWGSELECDVLKVPHHGSAEFSPAFLRATRPLVSVVSSGDESASKEYVHPSAMLMAALGAASRQSAATTGDGAMAATGVQPIILVTELAAFFAVEDWSVSYVRETPRRFYGFSRKAFGLVKIRTDGNSLLVWTDSGKTGACEAYKFDLTTGGKAMGLDWAK